MKNFRNLAVLLVVVALAASSVSMVIFADSIKIISSDAAPSATAAPAASGTAVSTPGVTEMPAVTEAPAVTAVAEATPTAAAQTNVLTFVLNSTVYTLNGVQKQLDAAPDNLKGSLAVPVKFISDAFGATATWDDSVKTATIVLNGKTQTLTVGVSQTGMPFAPYIKNGRLMVPLRYVAENFNCIVGYDSVTRTANISW